MGYNRLDAISHLVHPGGLGIETLLGHFRRFETMTTPHDASEAKADDLQFDEAEYAAETPSGPVCSACKAPIDGTYYAALGHLFCASCREKIEAARGGGSRTGRFVKAFVLGSIAAIVGGLIYYGITKATGLNIGLVSVVVGLMVGGAVKSGSGGRGGWLYQLLAVFLTYTAIAGMIVPDLVAELGEMGRREEAERLGRHVVDAPATVPPIRVVDAEEGPGTTDEPGGAAANGEGAGKLPDQVFADATPAAADTEDDDAFVLEIEDEPAPSLSGFLIGMVVFIGVAYALPVFMAMQSPISGLIYAFAIWEAWKINRRQELALEGPYNVEPRAGHGPVIEGPGHGA